MKQQFVLFLITIQAVWMVAVNAQNPATNVDIQNSNITISASEDIRLSTGVSGKAYYNDKEIAVKSDVGRGATIVIAASNASEKSKSGADYVCTGVNDQEVFSTALNSLPECGGVIQLTEGDFHFHNTSWEVVKDVIIQGNGSGTVIHRHFVCSGSFADSLLRAHPGKNWYFKNFTINSHSKQTEGSNNYEIFCWTPENGDSKGTCTIEDVHVINGLVHTGGDNTTAFFIAGADARIINSSVQGGSYTRAIHTSRAYRSNADSYIDGCRTDGFIHVDSSNTFTSNNKANKIQVNSYERSVVTGNITETLVLGGYRVYASGNVCDVLTNQTTNSLVVNNLMP